MLQAVFGFCSGWTVVTSITAVIILFPLIKWLSSPLRKIPGPKGSFLRGNSADFQAPNDPLQVLINWGKSYGDIYKTWNAIGGYVVHLQCPEHIKTVLVTESTRYHRPNFLEELLDFKIKGKSIFEVNGMEHAMQRRLLNPSFSYKSVQNYTPIFNEVADNLIEYWQSKIDGKNGRFEDDIRSRLTCLTLDVIGESAFGYKFNSLTGGHSKESRAADAVLRGQANLRNRALERFLPFLKLLPSKERQEADEAKDVLDGIVMKVIKERTSKRKEDENGGNKEKDLLQILLDTRDGNANVFNDKDILSQVRIFMIAGHETTSMAMTWTILLLAQQQQYQERVREEIRRVLGDKNEVTLQDVNKMTFLEDCIRESMRLYPPVIMIHRITTVEMQLGPYTIPKGTYIAIDIACCHRNNDVWKDAETFNPDRYSEETDEAVKSKDFLYNFMPFSRGPRMCIGYRFAEIEMKIVLAKLLRDFRFHLGASQPKQFASELALTIRPSPSPLIEVTRTE